MKHLLLTTIAAVLLVGCGESQPPEPPDLSIHRAALRGNIEAVKQAIADGANVNAKDEGTPLHHAAAGGHKEIVELLISKGADVNAKNNDEVTPLHWVADMGHKEIAEILITKGADVNAKIEGGDYKGDTPLDFAIKSIKTEIKTEIADLLRKHGGKTGEELKAEGK